MPHDSLMRAPTHPLHIHFLLDVTPLLVPWADTVSLSGKHSCIPSTKLTGLAFAANPWHWLLFLDCLGTPLAGSVLVLAQGGISEHMCALSACLGLSTLGQGLPV